MFKDWQYGGIVAYVLIIHV